MPAASFSATLVSQGRNLERRRKKSSAGSGNPWGTRDKCMTQRDMDSWLRLGWVRVELSRTALNPRLMPVESTRIVVSPR
jgi:hypothetical protein